jgi:hypothetical protein
MSMTADGRCSLGPKFLLPQLVKGLSRFVHLCGAILVTSRGENLELQEHAGVQSFSPFKEKFDGFSRRAPHGVASRCSRSRGTGWDYAQWHAGRIKNYPQLKARIKQHIQETRRQAGLVRECIERRGGSTSTLKDTGGKLLAMGQAMSGMFVGDEVMKSSIASFIWSHGDRFVWNIDRCS